ncbi:MAG TPA: nucleoside diphosphate kinase regulator [Candidatus Omnitrophica bacterium]|nr:nucleoside diphosphate kinase regulator [Candidatus Omnitrophota bacterium]
MSKKLIYITDSDMKRLRELVKVAREFGREDEKYLKELEGELDRGKIVKSKGIPNNVITMNSKVCLRNVDTQEEMVYWLVFPDDADPDQDKISILTPIGTALLGYKVGDIIEWKVPAGFVKLTVEKILYQPEAAGDYF